MNWECIERVEREVLGKPESRRDEDEARPSIGLLNFSPAAYLNPLNFNSATRFLQLIKWFERVEYLVPDEGHSRLW